MWHRHRWYRVLALVALVIVAVQPPAVGETAAAPAHPDSTILQPAAASNVWTIRSFATTESVVALTFDAGADRGYAAQILDTLAAEGVSASFGITGVWAERNPDLVRRMVAEGHHLMNHSWDHPSFTGYSTGAPPLTAAQRREQLVKTEDLIRAQTGVELRPYFRPPYGDYDDSVLADLASNGYTVNVMWTVDSLGWNGLTADQIRQRVLNGVTPGGIVLMHVGADSRDAVALPDIIHELRARGYRFATVRALAEGEAAPESRFFPETGQWVSHGFLRYWERFGGLPVFGYPLTGEIQEGGRIVQFFERARFEWHPGAWPERYDVLLGLLGNELTAGRRNEPPFRPVAAAGDANCTFYPETGHRLCFGFRDAWRARGGLPVIGYPISEEFVENGVVVQYFERQRFEWHPENQPPWDVLGGDLGRQVLARRND